MGTPHYMSPEQATGDQHVGPAADTYALGCVLYEMLVGEPPYTGSTAQAILGKIIAGELATARKQRASVPANVDAAIRKALEKLPADRFTGAQDFAKALADPGFRHGEVATTEVGAGVGPWKRLTMAMTGVAALFALAFGWSLLRPEPPEPIARFPSPFLEGQAPIGPWEPTPDGSALVYTGPGPSGAGSQLWIRRWENLSATPIPGTESARVEQPAHLSLSPDGREVAFTLGAGSPLRVVPLDGGQSRTLVPRAAAVGGWSEDGWVYFHDMTAIQRVRSTGGEAEVLTELTEGEVWHSYSHVLPGDRMVLFQVDLSAAGGDVEIWALDLETGVRKFVTVGRHPQFTVTGHLLFGAPNGVLMAAPFDLKTAELTGPAVLVAEGLSPGFGGQVEYSISQTGALSYRAGGASRAVGPSELVWVTRAGTATPVDDGWEFAKGDYFAGDNAGWRLSPDDDRIAFMKIVDGNRDIWIKELPNGRESRITFHGAREHLPQWSPDGQTLIFRSERVEQTERRMGHLFSKRADGIGDAELVFDGFNVMKGFWSPDNEWLILRKAGAARGIFALRVGTDSLPTALVASEEFREQGPSLSPDGRWLAYSSNETGQQEVWVRPFPNVDEGKVRVSATGGAVPVWAHNGRELFFLNVQSREMMAAEFETTPEFRVVGVETVFAFPPGIQVTENGDFFDVSSDDQRFLMARASGWDEKDSSQLILVQNFFEELKRLVPN